MARVRKVVLVGTGLAFASLILVPALASRWGVGSALTGAIRIGLMRASNRVVTGRRSGGETDADSACMSCL